MQNLFARVFVSFWLAIVLIAAGAAAVTAVYFVTDRNNPVTLTHQAQDVLVGHGIDGLRHWLAARNAETGGKDGRRFRMLILDRSGHDITGQRLPWHRPPPPPDREPRDFGDRPPREDRGPPPGPDGPREGFGPPNAGPRHDGPPPFAAAHIRAADGTIFRVMFDPPQRRGPFSPPFAWPVRLGMLALALAISGLVSFLLARSIARPLEALQLTARELATGNLGARTAPAVGRRRDEIGSLAREFDSMAQRLEALVAARTRLLRDISHELRSPLARLQMALGLARQNAASRDAQLDRIEREAGRLESMIAQVLEYARFERDPSSLQREPVDIGALLRQIAHDAEFEHQCAPGRITLAVDEELPPVDADAQVLHAAFDNVVRNALLHGDGSTVEVEAVRDGRGLAIRVRDRGPGVPSSDLERIFEPFYRVPRSQEQGVDGSGIGLAVTARAIALHRGSLTARNRDGGGLEIEIRLPL